jgi:hypothetical protein
MPLGAYFVNKFDNLDLGNRFVCCIQSLLWTLFGLNVLLISPVIFKKFVILLSISFSFSLWYHISQIINNYIHNISTLDTWQRCSNVSLVFQHVFMPFSKSIKTKEVYLRIISHFASTWIAIIHYEHQRGLILLSNDTLSIRMPDYIYVRCV